MEKIFYIDKSFYPSSEVAVKSILSKFFNIQNVEFERTPNGKLYLSKPLDARIFFSISHTKDALFIAFADENVGLDVELLTREVHYPSILKKFPSEEQKEIDGVETFLKHWTAKESAIKWLGGSLSHDLKKLSYVKNRLSYGNVDIPVHLHTKFWKEYILSICSERNFENAEIIVL